VAHRDLGSVGNLYGHDQKETFFNNFNLPQLPWCQVVLSVRFLGVHDRLPLQSLRTSGRCKPLANSAPENMSARVLRIGTLNFARCTLPFLPRPHQMRFRSVVLAFVSYLQGDQVRQRPCPILSPRNPATDKAFRTPPKMILGDPSLHKAFHVQKILCASTNKRSVQNSGGNKRLIPAGCLCDARENLRPFAKISERLSTETFLCNSLCMEPELLVIDKKMTTLCQEVRTRSLGRRAIGRK
jgi:hypothetical protein